MLDLLCNVLLQACIWFKPSHLSVSLGFLQGFKRTPAITDLGLNKGHYVVRTRGSFVRHAGALEHELPGVKHVRGGSLIGSREEVEHDGRDSQVKVEQCPGLDPVEAEAGIRVAFAVLVLVRERKTFSSESTEDHGVAQQNQDSLVELHRKFVCPSALGGAALDHLLGRLACFSEHQYLRSCGLPRPPPP